MKIPYLGAGVVESPVGILLTEAGERRNAMTISFFSEVATTRRRFGSPSRRDRTPGS